MADKEDPTLPPPRSEAIVRPSQHDSARAPEGALRPESTPIPPHLSPQRPSQRPSQWPSVVTSSSPEMTIGNLKLAIPVLMPEELFTTLAAGQGVRVERIVSRGHNSPEGFWYDQEEHEFVLVVQGRARIEVEGQGELDLRPGDYLVLPAHIKHRVTWTDPQHDTVWLAVYYGV